MNNTLREGSTTCTCGHDVSEHGRGELRLISGCRECQCDYWHEARRLTKERPLSAGTDTPTYALLATCTNNGYAECRARSVPNGSPGAFFISKRGPDARCHD